ncbi:MAG: protein-L-isoaspartate(D-aspartate) O-methyltransferase [Bacteroidota bacterium]|nr:protein-L-isoaspartate(D-aspartate) O-methyltransferase [Bacteroidota bacterium]MDP4233670.1 protein-L-isoaspartate(D-aspartate) O-methyltransferase [Bacteroidota bacterium]MDP4241873.1 protein-L-isoaspartate(D-aspartate) O-methyltransferase [Bacteroidota bacterium]MDP4288939.1 protein-L-isoaspartate(D-aspartate) O-methyltransferase [Bacteroidota bacterium]
MVSIARERLVEELRARGIRDERVLDAISKVPRERFLEATFVRQAYEDSALPIGEGQTISQPFAVAYQTEVLGLKPGEKILEIGTGSGYQAAILAQMGMRVYTIERHIPLLEVARKRLESLGYRVISRAGDGTRGWSEYAPFDAILVTAGAPDVPESLAKQLSPNGGRLVIPIGDMGRQRMYLIRKNGDELKAEELIDFAFVPLIGKEGWSA